MLSNIIIIGITGVGKTTVGKELARCLEKEFIDLDKRIETICGVDIPTIFEIEGEAGFRERESEELRRIITFSKNCVLSVGGGCIMREDNRTIISSGNNLVIQLYAEMTIVAERLAKSINKRPIFYNQNIERKIAELYAIRKDSYDRITDLKIDTSFLKLNHVINKIFEYLNKNYNLQIYCK